MSKKLGVRLPPSVPEDEFNETVEQATRENVLDSGTSLPKVQQENENRRSINYLYMSIKLWQWLVDNANLQGMKVERFILTLLEDQYKNWHEPTSEDSTETYVTWARNKADAISDAYKDTYAIAVNYVSHPTEETAKLLFKSCERLGIDPQELQQTVKGDDFAELLVQYRSDADSKMNRCIRWVIEFCRDKDEIPSQALNEAGENAGFTRQMIHSARRRVGIKSNIKNGEWYLVMPKSARVIHGTVTDE